MAELPSCLWLRHIWHIFSLSFQSVDTCVVSTSSLLWIKLRWTRWVQVSFWVSVFIFFRHLPRSEIAGPDGSSIFNLLRPPPHYSPPWLYQATFLPTVYRVFLLSTSLPNCVISYRFDAIHQTRSKMLSPCGSALLFSADEWACAHFHVPVAHPYVFFGKIFIQILCPFFTWIVWGGAGGGAG